MIVHKFGGASIKDAEAIRHIAKLVAGLDEGPKLFVVSAFGKTTNKLEAVVSAHWRKDESAIELLSEIRKDHEEIVSDLWPEGDGPVDELNDLFVELEWAIDDEPRDDYNWDYDQIVAFGELLSSTIVSAYLNKTAFVNQWLDARDLIKTDNNYRDARVDFELTAAAVNQYIKKSATYLTQGFIGVTSENFNATLGREGSDYSAALFAEILEADEVNVWKDVPGLMNADPKVFGSSSIIHQLSYADAIELAFYGAKVIHPRTIQPLKNSGIPLRIMSFVDRESMGTLVAEGLEQKPRLPFFIKRDNQVLISIRDPHLDFIAEDHMSEIFSLLAKYRLRVRLMQNSAVSFSVVGDHQVVNIQNLVNELAENFDVRFNTGLSLFTIKNYSEEDISETIGASDLLLEQRSRTMVQLLVKE